MILVTGASGKTGRAVIRALTRRGASVRALVRRPEQRGAMGQLGAQDVLVGDLGDPATYAHALDGVRAVYAIFPNMHPHEVALAGHAVDAARSAGDVRIVYHSVLHPQTETMPHHWNKLRVEARLFESGLRYTILQPAAYMQNVLAYRPYILDENRYPVPYALWTQLGMVDLEDVAAAAAHVLTCDGHEGAIYELAGPEVLDQPQIASALGAALGRDVRAETVPRAEWEVAARRSGLADYQVGTLRKMFEYYERYGFWGNPNVLTWLLGRPPITFAEFCRREFSKTAGG